MTLYTMRTDTMLMIWKELDVSDVISLARVCKRFQFFAYGSFGLDRVVRHTWLESNGQGPLWYPIIHEWWARHLWSDFGIAPDLQALQQPVHTIRTVADRLFSKLFESNKQIQRLFMKTPSPGFYFKDFFNIETCVHEKSAFLLTLQTSYRTKLQHRHVRDTITFSKEADVGQCMRALLYTQKRLAAKFRRIGGLYENLVFFARQCPAFTAEAFRSYDPMIATLFYYEFARTIVNSDMEATATPSDTWMITTATPFKAPSHPLPRACASKQLLPINQELATLLTIAIVCDIRFSESETTFLLGLIQAARDRCRDIRLMPPTVLIQVEALLRCHNGTLHAIREEIWNGMSNTLRFQASIATDVPNDSHMQAILFLLIELYLQLAPDGPQQEGQRLLACTIQLLKQELPCKWVVLWAKLAQKERDAEVQLHLAESAPSFLNRLETGMSFLEDAQWLILIEAFQAVAPPQQMWEANPGVIERTRLLLPELKLAHNRALLSDFLARVQCKPRLSEGRPPAKKFKQV